MDEPSAWLAADRAARERALDPTRSFVVQAPAGSGKTGLLIQRFLALLAHVERPERIVALTFTRKAAGEMRSRIVAALRDARDGRPVEEPHDVRTRSLAQAALARATSSDWRLLDQPARLRIETIDAFVTGLARAAPLATGLGGVPNLIENAEPLYARAAREALRDAPPDDADWRCVLAHVDNDAERAVGLLAQLLARRDAWLGRAVQPDLRALRVELEKGLAEEVEGELRAVAALVPTGLLPTLAGFETFAIRNLLLRPGAESHELALRLKECADRGGVPPAAATALEAWRALADWLRTQGDRARWRTRFDSSSGFPPAEGPDAAENAVTKRKLASFVNELRALPGLGDALDAVRSLPPSRYDDASWAVVAALLTVLPRVVAQLRLTLAGASAADFTEVTLAALRALGSGEEPSDLLLRLDRRIDHLLIDEFQDTSLVQLDLVCALVAGWQPGDGRTLFVVGDPMQSIYRFRNAEVRLFVDAQQEGRIANVGVESLALRRNFRAQGQLVEWTNRVFPGVLGATSDPWRSLVAFAPSLASLPALPGEPATLELVADAEAEAERVVARVRAALADEEGEIAILVRTRAALDAILPALRRCGIDYEAIDVDTLGQRRAILDLAALTHALVQPADRLAWLAAARAPWCGLALPDLYALAVVDDGPCADSLAARIGDPTAAQAMTPDGRERLRCFAATMEAALEARGRASVGARVRGAWIALGGPATLADALDVESAERFFSLVAEHEHGGDLPDWSSFVAALDDLRASPAADPRIRVKVMTLHKAKGLEFGTVVIPGLASSPRSGPQPLLRWRQRPSRWLLAPAPEKGGERTQLYEYLKRLEQTEEDAELGRLLYVGCTRAKRRLHLVASCDLDASAAATEPWRPRKRSPLALLAWGLPLPAPPLSAVARPRDVPRASRDVLERLPALWSPDVASPPLPVGAPVPVAPEAALPFDWVREAARHVGTVVHRVLHAIAHDGVAAWDADRIERLRPWLAVELRTLGVGATEAEAALDQTVACLRGTIAHPRGRFAFDPTHAEARSEWALAGEDEGALAHVRLDRTFVAAGERWIIDFKTGAHEGGEADAFLDQELERYRPQLERYARLLRGLDERPIRLALFYPRIGGWREWRFEG